MKHFYKDLINSKQEKKFLYRFYRESKSSLSSWYRIHSKILRHSGLGGKSHVLEKGHVQWNRKGRW
ncbi:MAG: hypothetical protein EH225_05810 [Calditrichaeota bacterium]|nr:hypothetical protein [Calditrichota bacterium]RQW04526.1 MAG: hypothetical protein EH225_05810 [Calditrichota bacterium]